MSKKKHIDKIEREIEKIEDLLAYLNYFSNKESENYKLRKENLDGQAAGLKKAKELINVY